MNDGDGMYTMELQAKDIYENVTRYNGSAPMPYLWNCYESCRVYV
jgi:hypothetical protein